MDEMPSKRRRAMRVTLPAELAARGADHWNSFVQAAASSGVSVPDDKDIAATAGTICAWSQFVARSCIRHPDLLADLIATGDTKRSYGPDDYRRLARAYAKDAQDDDDLGKRLRRLRKREMVRIAWRDLAGWADLEETMGDLSCLAEACLNQGLFSLDRWQQEEFGCPVGRSGAPQSLVVLGMGKLGGAELNFSSDIDLIFAFPEGGNAVSSGRSVTNEEYFTRLCQRLTRTIGSATADGFVFRVDTRLRPYGENGPLVLSFDAMEEYYQSQGRDWERYAMIKARAVAGDVVAGNRLLETLKPFVYRRYLDYGAFDSLREMKSLIEHETYKRGLLDNIKLGKGGIREIEFTVQTFQIIRGGRVPELQQTGTLRALDTLSARGYLPEELCEGLRSAYLFLRDTEHRLQQFDDQQTHSLPQADIDRIRLATSMHFPVWEQFAQQLKGHRDTVRSHFKGLFSDDSEGKADHRQQALRGIWLDTGDDQETISTLSTLGFTDPQEALRLLKALRQSRKTRALGQTGRERLDRLMPMVLRTAADCRLPDLALKRLLGLVESIEKRTCYISLLAENPRMLSQLVKLFSEGAWIASLLSSHPILLDELLDPERLYACPHRNELETELAGILSRLPENDLEGQMDELRRFRQANLLRIAAADIAGALSVEEVSAHLTDVAETVVRAVLRISWGHLEKRHGPPPFPYPASATEAPGFVVVAYGKLGGREMGYGSDLDLVFLHSGRLGETTKGNKPLETVLFFSRLGQRMIHIFSTHTSGGILYEVDMRLRPEGASGVLVSTMDTFSKYQTEQAWTWEHQAMVRARAIAGDSQLRGGFERLRKEIICRRRDTADLRDAVRSMRARMTAEPRRGRGERFDLKQDPGGLVDIEFLVQYLVLANAWRHNDLAERTGSVELLTAIRQKGLLPEKHAERLISAYLYYRKTINEQNLQERDSFVDADDLGEVQSTVRAIWQEVIEPS
jgi:glutamate-ammonia-ligase adenylyltransferase